MKNEFSKQELWETFNRRFKTETYVSEIDGLYCPMKLINFVFSKRIDGSTGDFKSRYLNLRKEWFERQQIQTLEGNVITFKDIESLSIQPNGILVKITQEHKIVEAEGNSIKKIRDLKLLNITESFIQNYRNYRNTLQEIPNIIFVMKEMMPGFEVLTTNIDEVLEEIKKAKNEECLNLLIRMSDGILNDFEKIFSKIEILLN